MEIKGGQLPPRFSKQGFTGKFYGPDGLPGAN